MTTQDQINDAEWDDPANWSSTFFGVYFSKRDSRMWVPKKVPSWGWTLNMGYPASAWWVVGLITVPAVVARSLRRRSRATD